MKSFVIAISEIQIALISKIQSLQKEILRTFLSLFRISCFKLSADLHQVNESLVSAKKQISEMTCQSLDKMLDVKSIFHNIVKQQQNCLHPATPGQSLRGRLRMRGKRHSGAVAPVFHRAELAGKCRFSGPKIASKNILKNF